MARSMKFYVLFKNNNIYNILIFMSIFPILFLILKSSQSLPNSLRNLVVDLSKGDLMERLKSCLNLAISKQAQCVRLIAGGPPQIMLPNQTIEGDGGADMTSEQLREIINATMPGRWFSSPSEVLDGSLNIGGPGVLLMRSRADGQLRIDFYFPSSGTMFQSDILEQKSRQAPPAVAPQVFPVAISIPSLSVPSQANPAAPVAVISIPPIPAMAIPARPAMAIPIPAMPIPEIPVAPAPASSVRPAAAPVAEEGMFRVASAPRPQSAPAALAAQALPLPIPQREHIAPPRMHAPNLPLGRQLFELVRSKTKTSCRRRKTRIRPPSSIDQRARVGAPIGESAASKE